MRYRAACLVFLAGALVDALACGWTIAATHHAPITCALLSGVLGAITVYGIAAVVEDKSKGIPYVLGHAVGSLVAISVIT